jgi:hypothetical protein
MYVSLKYRLVNVMYSLDPWWCLCRYCSLGDIGFRCSLKDAVLLLVACCLLLVACCLLLVACCLLLVACCLLLVACCLLLVACYFELVAEEFSSRAPAMFVSL